MAEAIEFLIDTSILLAHARQTKAPTVFDRAKVAFGIPAVSDVTVFEIDYGGIRAGRQNEFERLFQGLATLPLSKTILKRAAHVQAELFQLNQAIGVLDVFIAATALEHQLPIFTLNVKHFQRIAGLVIVSLP